ncbi:MAG: hypothetical protein EAX86_09675 [Candidatus Heimdallarchaeota archaeon]|nr:hypothetical protein [Candidatus Heimdallarchaeota archaeon]
MKKQTKAFIPLKPEFIIFDHVRQIDNKDPLCFFIIIKGFNYFIDLNWEKLCTFYQKFFRISLIFSFRKQSRLLFSFM